MKPLQQIVVSEIKRRYESEKAFYERTLGITQQSWNRWKNGERDFKPANMNSIKSLFSPYEWQLIEKINSDMAMYPNNFKDEPTDVFIKTKKSIAYKWVNFGASISVNSALSIDDPSLKQTVSGTKVTVSLDYNNDLINSSDIITFYVNQSSAHIKAGKENRKKWFFDNLKELY